MKLSLVLSAVTLVAFQAIQVAALCYRSDRNGRCGDNTGGTPCCGYGKCNIFCCNCDGGCRDPKVAEVMLGGHGRYSHAHNEYAANPLSDAEQAMECSDKMKEFDANGDGLFTFFEYLNMNPITNMDDAMDRWVKFDWERKGYMTFVEAYERKA